MLGEAKRRLAKMPIRDWIIEKKSGTGFIPLVLQTQKMLKDVITILNTNALTSVGKKKLGKSKEDEGKKKILEILKGNEILEE